MVDEIQDMNTISDNIENREEKEKKDEPTEQSCVSNKLQEMNTLKKEWLYPEMRMKRIR